MNNNPLLVYKGLPKSAYYLFAARIIDNMGNFIIPLITLILTSKIGLSTAQAGTFSTIFMIAQAPFLLLSGKLIDRYGSKRVIVIFTSLGALTYLPCAVVKPGFLMAGFIALAASFFSVASPAFNSIVPEIYHNGHVKKVFSLLYLGYNLGYSIGPFLGGLMFNRHLHLLFFLDSVTAFLSTGLIFFFVKTPAKEREKTKPHKIKENIPEASSAFHYLIRSKVLIIFSLVYLLYNFAFAQWSFMLPLQSTAVFKSEGPRIYSFFICINALAIIFLTPFLTNMTHRFRALALIAFGGLFYFISFTIFGFDKHVHSFVVAVIIMTMGQILINLNVNIYIAERTPKMLLGRINSLISIINGAGLAIGPIIMGHVLLFWSYRYAWIAVALLMLIGSVAMLELHRLEKNKDFQNGTI